MNGNRKALYFDQTFLTNLGGIGRDSRFILSILQRIPGLEVKPFDPLLYKYSILKILTSKQLGYVRTVMRILAVLRNKPIRVQLPINSISFQSQATVFKLSGLGLHQILRVHDLFPITNPEWFTWFGKRSFLIGIRESNDKKFLLCDSIATLNSLKLVHSFSSANTKALVFYCSPESQQKVICGKCQYCCAEILAKNFFLIVSTIEPRKNHAFVLRAWFEIKKENQINSSHQLIVVGKVGWKSRNLVKMMKAGKKSGVIWIEECCDGGMAVLIKNAIALISSSFNEGFDLPPGEALLEGTPVLLSDIPVHHEIYGNHAKYFALSDNTMFKQLLVQSSRVNLSTRSKIKESFQLENQSRTIKIEKDLTLLFSTLGN